MRDTIYRDEAIEAVGEWMQKEFGFLDLNRAERLIDALSALPSAEAEPTVIRSRTLMPTKDFKEWAKRIREVNPNAVVIPCDAEVVSAEAEWIPCSERLPEDLEAVNDAPTVQADRPHGEWIEREDWNGDSYYDCSVCGESFVLCDGTPSMNLYHYCPNCGADMRGDK